jgi:hypothetical protein
MLQNRVDERIAALENQNRRWRRFSWIAGLVLAALTMAVIEGYREMEDLRRYGVSTTGLQIRDESDAMRASLGIVPGSERPYFKFVDGEKNFRMFLALDEEGPTLTLSDSRGRARMRLAAHDDGGVIELLDANGEPMWSAP